MGAPIFFHLFLLVGVVVCVPALARDNRCLPDFETKPEQFDVCLREECFIFRSEKPYIFLDSQLNASNNQVPFRCVEYKQKWAGLDGVFFQMVMNMPLLVESHCVFAGNECTFDGILSFIDSAAITGNHTWIAGGVLFVLQNRILPGAVASTSILEDALHIVGPKREKEEMFVNAASLVVKPFTLHAWLVFLSSLGFFGLVRIILIFMYGRTRGWPGFVRYLFLVHFEEDLQEREQWETDMWRIGIRHWGASFIIFSSIMLLLYEVALAVIAFDSIGLEPLVHLKAEEFAVYENTTEEYLFQLMVGSSTRHTKFNSLDAVYGALADKSNNLSFTVSYGVDNRYKFTAEPELCENLQLYESVPTTLVSGRTPPPITGVWFYSDKILPARRMEIDKAILGLKEVGGVIEMVNVAVGGREVSAQCRPGRTQIGWYILFMLVALPIAYLVLISLTLSVACFGKGEEGGNEDGSNGSLPVMQVCSDGSSTSGSDGLKPRGSAPGSTISEIGGALAPNLATVAVAAVGSVHGNKTVNLGLTEVRQRPPS